MKNLKAQASVIAFIMDSIIIIFYFGEVFLGMPNVAVDIIWISLTVASIILSAYSYFKRKHILLSTFVLLLSFLLAALYVAQKFMN